MTSLEGRPSGQPTAAQAMSTRDLQSSNSTTIAFLGGKRKEWMSGTASTATKKSAQPSSSGSVAFSHREANLSDLSATVNRPDAIQKTDYSRSPFPPDFDRGRFPLQRRRRGGTMGYPKRQRAPATSGVSQTALFPPTKEDAGNVSKEFPSPSASVEIYRQGTNIVGLENEMAGHETPGTIHSTRLEEIVALHGGIEAFEKKLQEVGNPSKSVLQKNHLTNTSASAASALHEVPTSLPHPVQADGRRPSAWSKRSSANVQEPRKRLQSLPVTPSKASNSEGSSSNKDGHNTVQNSHDQALLCAAEMQDFNNKVSQRLLFSGIESRLGNGVEHPRLNLLRDACERADCFYLCLHQIYCRDHIHRSLGKAIPAINEDHRGGLHKLSHLLVPNEKLSIDAIKWFAEFPLPLDVLLPGRPAFQSAYDKALQSLTQFQRNWEIMRSRCGRRDYPPLVDELVDLFGVESFTFQQVVFRAFFRDIWNAPQDQCFQHIDEMFPRSYKEVMLRRSTQLSTVASTKAFIHEYQQVSLAHCQQHLQEKSMSTVPLQQRQPLLLPRQTTQSLHDQTVSVHHPHGSPSSSLNSATRSTPLIIQNGFSTSARALGVTAPQGAPVTQPEAQSKHGYCLHQDAATTGSSLSQDSVHMQPPNTHPVFSNQGFQQHSTDQARTQPLRVDQPSSNDPYLMGSVPSGIGGNVDPSVPPGFQMHSMLPPSNAPAPDLGHTRQTIRELAVNAQQGHLLPSKDTQLIQANLSIDQSQYNPALYALHQAHLRSPTLALSTLQGKDNAAKFMRHIKQVIMPPGALSNAKRHISWDFHVDSAIATTLAKDTPCAFGSPPMRVLHPDSRLCRIRCIKIDAGHGLPSESYWVAADNIWPGSTAILLNGEPLEARKKSHHGKDLPIDATRYVKEGKNTIESAIIGLPEESTIKYAIGIEIIELVHEQWVKNHITTLPFLQARERLLNRANNVDPEIQILNHQTTLDLTDPFTARLFDVPLRGESCRHNQCFDRDVFLSTRNCKNPKEPCGPDEFRCPICGSDARPLSLVIDGFFLHLREELQKAGRLDAKAVILHTNGKWEIKEEEEGTGEQGDGSDRRDVRNRRSAGRQSTPKDVIQIVDDD